MDKRPIPSSGELLPVIGCGTYRAFDVDAGTAQHGRLPGVLRALRQAGGCVIDSSPMYGRAEAVAGALLASTAGESPDFIATKVWIRGREAGIRQMEESLRLFGVDAIDLLQVHNLVDWRTLLPTLRDWKARGRIRYIGVTHYSADAYAELEAVMRSEALDFIQVNYALDDREAERRIMPLAAERGIAVLANMPFGAGRLLQHLSGKPLPGWAAEIAATSWPQLLLKFVLSHPAVTCAIPGTGRPEHMADNAAAGSTLPGAAFWSGRIAGALAP